MTFSRYAGPGSHRYPIGFSGDTHITWESLDFQPYFTTTATNIGYGWWSHDIGGHMLGYKDDELTAHAANLTARSRGDLKKRLRKRWRQRSDRGIV